MIIEQATIDPESRIGRAVKAKDLGYRLHLTVDVKSELPVAMIVVSANENEKKHSINLFRKASEHVKPAKLLADSQYSAANLRDAALEWELYLLFLIQRTRARASRAS